jgi:hypothetical protein
MSAMDIMLIHAKKIYAKIYLLIFYRQKNVLPKIFLPNFFLKFFPKIFQPEILPPKIFLPKLFSSSIGQSKIYPDKKHLQLKKFCFFYFKFFSTNNVYSGWALPIDISLNRLINRIFVNVTSVSGLLKNIGSLSRRINRPGPAASLPVLPVPATSTLVFLSGLFAN